MADPDFKFSAPVPLVALAGWLVPGAGYVLIGQMARGVTTGVTILALFVLGLLIGGMRVIDVPGYDDAGQQRVRGGRWALVASPVGELAHKPWYVPQILAGPITLVSGAGSLSLARQGIDPSQARIRDIGTLYTAVAGMLNLMTLLDAAHRAARKAGAR
ncbi:MAG TPA: hypothetical protein PKB10_02215 [Tepidisphaeraceae bacterium]|nr:hypothetical protein [Tepidisphaeraceae bacterium]